MMAGTQHSFSQRRQDHGRRLGLRAGVTLVEIIVCLVILALLMSLILPGIGKSRGAADATMCRSRMRQVGLAVHNFEGRNGRYPDGIGMLDWHFEILPDLERGQLFRQLLGKEEDDWTLHDIMRGTSLPELQCPSDPKSLQWKWSLNLMRNGWPGLYAVDEDDRYGFMKSPLSSRDVTDGLSATAYLSERMNEFLDKSKDRRGTWRTTTVSNLPDQLDQFADLCELMPQGTTGQPNDSGPITLIGGSKRYDHIVCPNRATCFNGVGGYPLVARTANSLHTGGVNVLMADGAVRFVNDQVARKVWRAMGTRNGNESFVLP